MNKDLKRLIKALEDAGYTVGKTKDGHPTIHAPNGNWVTNFAGTPSDRRGWRNGLAALKRSGFKWPP
ncbi:hypothetical protein [Aeromicrobium sp. Leaf291]|uniref:hypothetical protein n=1 Tax=Aeromicrobium sp. Leaf291 TaxID=1736325 RepID=UPI0006FFDF32|nr:hypothetical protein [Aeromicrobium sp. Leaf291]KQP81551.1 hypothetical protein ASF35_16095 [Aeromicrobium sp. Leaf291]